MLRDIKVLHLEPTDVCQLSCPLCARETDAEFNPALKHHLKIAQIEKHFSEEQIKALDKMFMCGNYGDPAAGYYTLDIYRWFRELNPNIVLGMNTNGALQSTFWWYELAKIMNQPRDYVVFSIDGLEDTNSVYRVKSNWSKLMANVEAFIDAGGIAHWDMLVYRHNQHQVDACEQLARDLGFTWFRAKVSKRPLANRLEYPIKWTAPDHNNGPISCHALKEQSAFIDACGRLSPCCWLGSRQSDFIKDISEVKDTWTSTTPNAICVKNCSTTNNVSVFEQQWQRNVNLQEEKQ